MRVRDRMSDMDDLGRNPAAGKDRNALDRSPRVMVGGLGYWWHGDGSLGLIASTELARHEWPEGVDIADLGYGALYVAQDLGDAEPPYDRLILLAAVERGRDPGCIYRYRWEGSRPDAEEIQERIFEAGAGVIDLDHLLVIAQHFDALPDDVIVIEVEPIDLECGERLSTGMAGLLPEVIDLVRREVLAPVMQNNGSRATRSTANG